MQPLNDPTLLRQVHQKRLLLKKFLNRGYDETHIEHFFSRLYFCLGAFGCGSTKEETQEEVIYTSLSYLPFDERRERGG